MRGVGALDGRADAPVMPDRGGEGEEAYGDTGVYAGQGVAVVGPRRTASCHCRILDCQDCTVEITALNAQAFGLVATY